MRKKVQKIFTHPLISGSSIVFIGSFLMSIGNYIYNLFLGRVLSIEEYGLIVSLSSSFILIGIFSNAFTNIFVKFSAKFKGSENEQGLGYLFSYGVRFLSIFACILFIVLLLLTPFLKGFLRIENTQLIYFIIAASIFSLFLTLPLGILQGRMQFISLSLANFSQPIVKIVSFFLFFSLGFSIYSPLIALALSPFVPMVVLYIYYFLKYKKKVEGKFDNKEFKREFFTYSYTYVLTGAGIALLSNTDILFVRYFFNETVSGQYAALSLMGKAIFYLVSPINFAFFPIIAYKRERKESLLGTVLMAICIVSVASLTISFFYFAFPSLVLSIFFPAPEYKTVGSYLGFFSLYIFIFSLASLMSNFFLSIGKTNVYKISLIASLVQIILLIFFHDSLYEVIGAMFVASLLFFIMLLWYYGKHGRD